MFTSLHTKTIALLMAGLMLLATVTTATATELHDAAKHGNIKAIERLLEAGANVNAIEKPASPPCILPLGTATPML